MVMPTMEEEIKAVMQGRPLDPVETEVSDPAEEMVDPAYTPSDPAEVQSGRDRDDAGRFSKKAEEVAKATETPEAVVTATPTTKIDPPPAALSAVAKAKWDSWPAEARAEITKREADVHKMFTSHDGELNLGRKMKEVVTPYMPIIQAEGGTPETAVRDLLNTAYVLRTSQPAQKAQLIQKIIADYNVDMSLLENGSGGQQTSPDVAALQNEIATLKQQANPQVLISQLRDTMENEKIQTEVNAFAADAKNVHFQNVKPEMASFMQSGQAKNLQEAYDMACWAKPDIRSTLLATQRAEEQAKQKQVLDAKKKAAVSVAGSPGSKSNSNGKSEKSLEDELREAMQAGAGGL